MGKRKSPIAWQPIRNIMKSVGGLVVQKDAVDKMIKVLDEQAREITTKALNLAKHAGRKKIMIQDIEMVIA